MNFRPHGGPASIRSATCRSAARGQVGYEARYSSAQLAAGELTEIIAAGYTSAIGTFGIHRFHYVIDDDARCVSAVSVAETAAAFRRLLIKIA